MALTVRPSPLSGALWCAVCGRDLQQRLSAHLHQSLQFCDDASDPVLIENNGVTLEWGCNLFSSDSLLSMRKE